MKVVVLGLLVVAIDIRLPSVDFLLDPVGFWIAAGGLHSIEHRHPWLHRARVCAVILIFLSIPYVFAPINQLQSSAALLVRVSVTAVGLALIWFVCGAIAELVLEEDASIAELAIRRRNYFALATLAGFTGLVLPITPVVITVVAAQLVTFGLVLHLFYRVGQLPGW